jgi:hypothetical protein
VQEQNAQQQRIARDDVERQVIGNTRCANVDVPPNTEDGRDSRERVEYGEIADVPRVQDGVGRQRPEMLRRRGVRRRVGVGYDGQPQ